MKTKSLHAALAGICLLIGATSCNLQVGGAGPKTWIDAPLDGTTFPLGPVIVRSHAASPAGTTKVTLLVNGAQVREDSAADASQGLIEFVQNWTPTNPGDYMLQVISTDNGGNTGRSNLVLVHIGGVTITDTPTATSSAEIPALPIIQPPPSVTPSPTVASGPSFTFDKNGNCRIGPSTDYEVATSFLAGQQLPIDGRNEDSSWFWLPMPGGGHCWASAATGVPYGPFTSAAVILLPLPPVATPEAAPPPPAAPGAPGKFAVKELQCDASKYIVRLVWQDVSGEDGYRVYRDGALISGLGADAASYDDTLPDYKPHSYRVEAFNGSGAGSTGSKSSTGCLY
jgi:hypothetical protein